MARVVRLTFGLSIVVIMAMIAVGCFAADLEPEEPVASATPTAPATVTSESPPTATSVALEPTPAGSPEAPAESAPVSAPGPPRWEQVGRAVWNDTFEVTLEVFGPSMVSIQDELRARTVIRNISDERGLYIRWSQDDPDVPLWVVLPSADPPPDSEWRPVARLIELESDDDPVSSLDSLPETQLTRLDPEHTVEREASWNLTVRGDSVRQRLPAPDGVYTLRADFYPHDGQQIPGQPDIQLEFSFELQRGISGEG